MKTLAMMVALGVALGAAVPAHAIEVMSSSGARAPLPDLAAVPVHAVAAHARLPRLPEPEVVAMMLVGLVLIGYRATRTSDEKFE